MVRDPGDTAVDVCAPQLLGRHLLAGGGFDQGRPSDKYGAGVFDYHRLVGHGRYVGPSGGAGAHHDCYLGYPHGRHDRLVVEDPAEVVPVWKYLGL